jgi:uncharacterized protein YqeY
MILTDIQKLKMTARKNKETEMIPFLSLLISQIQIVGKNAGGRDTTDDEALRVIKQLIAANEETLLATTSSVIGDPLIKELNIMKPFLPTMVSAEEVQKAIDELVSSGADNIGALMGGLKKRFGSTIDMKMANPLVREALQ